jgi:hypothetical protein
MRLKVVLKCVSGRFVIITLRLVLHSLQGLGIFLTSINEALNWDAQRDCSLLGFKLAKCVYKMRDGRQLPSIAMVATDALPLFHSCASNSCGNIAFTVKGKGKGHHITGYESPEVE